MIEVAFHFGAPDKIAYASRLLRKASASGARIHVLGDPVTLASLDTALWALGPTDFVAHRISAEVDSPANDRQAVLLGTRFALGSGKGRVLVNLASALPEMVEEYERVIEVVSTAEDDRAQARNRWKFYKSKGHPIVRHDLRLKDGS